MPQYLGSGDEIERFRSVAASSGARFCEIVLMDTKASSIRRFARRGEHSPHLQHRVVQQLVDRSGGATYLAAMHDELAQTMQSRQSATIVHTEVDSVERTYLDVVAAIAQCETSDT